MSNPNTITSAEVLAGDSEIREIYDLAAASWQQGNEGSSFPQLDIMLNGGSVLISERGNPLLKTVREVEITNCDDDELDITLRRKMPNESGFTLSQVTIFIDGQGHERASSRFTRMMDRALGGVYEGPSESIDHSPITAAESREFKSFLTQLTAPEARPLPQGWLARLIAQLRQS